jgi:mRNA interferase MazF
MVCRKISAMPHALPPPCRGEVWLADLAPTRGHEQSGRRPVLIVSVDLFNQGPADLVIVAPITSTTRPIRYHVHVDPPEGGLKKSSDILCEAVRSISKERLVERWGILAPEHFAEVEDRLRILLGL